MFVEGFASLVPLKEVEHIPVIIVSSKAIVDHSRFRSSKTCGFGVDSFEGVGMLRVGVNL